MSARQNHGAIAAGLVFAVFLWGGNNTGVKFLVKFWPPIWVGSTRFLCAGLVLLAILRLTRWLGVAKPLNREISRQLWWQGGLILAVYIVTFNWALHFTAASHVALYLGASPVWALLLEGRSEHRPRVLIQRFAAGAMALIGVAVLFLPNWRSPGGRLPGELLGFLASMLWTCYGRQCRRLSASLSGAEITAHTMWRAGLLLLPLAILEAATLGVTWNFRVVTVQAYCVVAGGVTAFALWNHALRHWKTSEVYLFNNLIPLSTMLWAHVCLNEPVTPTFWLAMVLIISGVALGQANWPRLLGERWLPME